MDRASRPFLPATTPLRLRSTIVFVLLLSLLALSPVTATPRVLILLTDYVGFSDVAPFLPAAGAPGLMSEGTPATAEPLAVVYASLSAGDSIRPGDVSAGKLAESLGRAGVTTALIGDADGDDTGRYRPALGLLPNPGSILVGVQAGERPDALSPGGTRVDPGQMTAIAASALSSAGVVAVYDGDLARLERERNAGVLLPVAYAKHRRDAMSNLTALMAQLRDLAGRTPDTLFLFVSSCGRPVIPGWGGTSANPGAIGWNSLAPCALMSPASAGPPQTVTSATTHTKGLIASRDIAPTILAHLGVPIPIQMTGAPIRTVPMATNGIEWLARLDRNTTLDQEVQTPFFWVIGFFGGFAALASLWLCAGTRQARSGRWAKGVCYALRVAISWPLALLIAPVLDPHSVAQYLGEIVAAMLLIALIPVPEQLLFATAAVVVVDGLTGSHLIARSVLSTYALAGIRFYGIGNEYMGMLIAGSLCFVTLRQAGSQGLSRKMRIASLVWFVLADIALSFPAFGAKAGGAVTATATFLFAWWLMQGKVITVPRYFGAVAAGFGLVFLWAGVDKMLGASAPTHIDSAVSAATGGRFGYILGVAVRKIGLAVRVITHPGTLLGLAGFALLGSLAKYWLGRRIGEYVQGHPARAVLFGAGLRGAVVALLFNDSGIVAAILILMSLTVVFIHGIVTEDKCGSFASMSAK